jgi:hypothetical protein
MGERSRSATSRWKLLLFALLALDTAYFAIAGTPSKAVDAVAWLVLLVLFEVETQFRQRGAATHAALRYARLLAAFSVLAATVGYVFEENVLDTVNTVLWIAVVVLLEIEFRKPALAARRRLAFSGAAVALYGGLAVLVGLWAWRGEWFDAYDALLWLLAFATIELDAINRGQTPSASTGV